ncbi:cellobiose-specific PTS system IIA component [Secundilactobacillus pentosiphilus]|uniref:Cellobiose-specific PTS system IIA component n=1 Tax=Secundilactobacillus pentosiphilus TaxID=1714682 RepID=A0A1Z5IZ60_9LACO|nr:PTS lactose/cellobiose transporter subunit IIA [Secundilactobacillus pentosiphilus]GAX07067.1 cellobiose-specific PTS system IIA component [Secundilactobacillus pentosiphilus]
MSDDEQHVAMQLILAAGDVKKMAFAGIELAKEGQISAAQVKFADAEKRLGEGHRLQSTYVSAHVDADEGPSLLMVHAQDHLSMALTTVELGRELVSVYAQLNRLKQ